MMADDESPEEQLAAWLKNVPGYLEQVRVLLGDAAEKLDYSIESCDVVGSWLVDRYPNGYEDADLPQPEHDLVVCYLGEVLIRQIGGRWAAGNEKSSWGAKPVIRFDRGGGDNIRADVMHTIGHSYASNIRELYEQYLKDYGPDSEPIVSKPVQKMREVVAVVYHPDVEAKVKAGASIHDVERTVIPNKFLDEYRHILTSYHKYDAVGDDVFIHNENESRVKISPEFIAFSVLKDSENRFEDFMDATMAAREIDGLSVYCPTEGGTWYERF